VTNVNKIAVIRCHILLPSCTKFNLDRRPSCESSYSASTVLIVALWAKKCEEIKRDKKEMDRREGRKGSGEMVVGCASVV